MKNRNIIKLYCVEYACIDGSSTYEIFRTLDEAKSFAYTAENWDYETVPLFIFSVDFDSKSIYEEDGGLNYDDCYGLWQGNYEFIEKLGKIPNCFERY